MLSIISCAFRPSACLLWRSVCLGLLPIFWLGCLTCSFLNFIYCLFLFIYFILAALGLHGCTQAFSSGGKQGVLSGFGAQAPHCGGFSFVEHGLESTGSVVVAHGLSCSMACGTSPEQRSNLCPLHRQVDF